MDEIPGEVIRKYFDAMVTYRCDEIRRAASALEMSLSGLPLSTDEMDVILHALEDAKRALASAIAVGRGTDSVRPRT